MSVVGAREANRSFSKILKEAENGETVTITRNGKPVARLMPMPKKQWKSESERLEAIRKMVETMERGMHLGGKGFTRDEMHVPSHDSCIARTCRTARSTAAFAS